MKSIPIFVAVAAGSVLLCLAEAPAALSGQWPVDRSETPAEIIALALP